MSTPAKFNCIVPGTLYDYSTDCPPMSAFTESLTTPAAHPQPMTTSTISNSTSATIQAIATTRPTSTTITTTSAITFGSNLIEVGSVLFYIVVGAVSGVLILLLAILIMCTAVWCLAADKGKSYTITTAAMYRQQIQSGKRENPQQQWSQIQGDWFI